MLKLTPHPFQNRAAEVICDFFDSSSRGDKLCIASPTGSGKSVIELLVKSRLSDCTLVTPRIEIILGMLEKLGYEGVRDWSKAKVIDVADSLSIYTPVRFRNKLLAGEFDSFPTRLIWDEGHHQIAESYQQIELLLGLIPQVMLTATPYRGTPKSTVEFRKLWGEPLWVMTYPEAAKLGVIHIPECETYPLLDDDMIEVTNGQFVINSMNSYMQSRLGDLASLIRKYHPFDRPTICAVPSTEMLCNLSALLASQSIPSRSITQETPYRERIEIIDSCLRNECVVLFIRALGEGVDIHARRLIDALPSLSPVDFMQRIGRVMRPVVSGPPSHYIACNRNLLRHAYLLEGLIPDESLIESVKAFGSLGKRQGMGALGLEALGRFRPTEVELRNGNRALCYILSTTESNMRVEYAVITTPTSPAIWVKKETAIVDGKPDWKRSKWKRTNGVSDLQGFASAKLNPLSDAQKKWWGKCASLHGLKSDQKVTTKEFQVLPILSDIRERLK